MHSILHHSLVFFQIVIYGSFNFIMLGYLFFALNLYLPLQVIQLFGEEYKGIALGLVTALGAIASTIMAPTSAYISDVYQLPRIPFVIFGMTCFSVCTLLRCLISTHESQHNAMGIIFVIVLVILSKLSYSIAYPVFNALLVDHFPKSMYGIVSAVIGFSTLLSAIYGSAIPGLIIHKIQMIHIVIVYTCICAMGILVLVIGFPEIQKYKQCVTRQKNRQVQIQQQQEDKNRMIVFLQSMGRPFKHWNFAWLFAARFVTMMAFGFGSSFQLYFLRDLIGHSHNKFNLLFLQINNAEEANSISTIFNLIPSIMGVGMSLCLSHAFGKVNTVIATNIILAICNICNLIFLDFNWLVLFQTIQGFCVGVFFALELTLINENLPNKKETAKDLSLFSVAFNTPQIIAGPIGGIMIQIGNSIAHDFQWTWPYRYMGYYILFITTALLQLMGACCMLFVKKNAK